MKTNFLTFISIAVLGGLACSARLPKPTFALPERPALFGHLRFDAGQLGEPAKLSEVHVIWTLARPSSSLAVLDHAEGLEPTLQPDVPGQYAVTLTFSKGERKVATTKTITVPPLMDLPVHLGEPWNEVVAAKMPGCEVVPDPLISSMRCALAAPLGTATWSNFETQSVKEGRVATIIADLADSQLAQSDRGYCTALEKEWGVKLQAVGLEQDHLDEGSMSRTVEYHSDAGIRARATCWRSGTMNSSLELTFDWTYAEPSGTCRSLKQAPARVRVLANMSLVEVARAAYSDGDIVDPGLECNHPGSMVGPNGIAALTYVSQRFSSTKSAYASSGRAPRVVPEWLVRQVHDALASVKIPGGALPIAQTTWTEASTEFKRNETLEATWSWPGAPHHK